MTTLSYQQTAQQLTLTGELTRHSVMTLPKGLLQKLFKQSATIINLDNITKIDSAGLAWLLLAVEKAGKLNSKLTLQGLSDDAVKLANLSGVYSFLPIEQQA